MKRITALVLATIMLMAVLTACGGTKEVDLNSLMSEINTTYGFSGLKTIEDTDSLERYFQVDPYYVEDFAAEMSTDATQYTTIIIIKATKIEAVSTYLMAYYDSLLSTAKSYDADQVSMIQSCSVKETGNYVYLVISDKFDEITATIDAALK